MIVDITSLSWLSFLLLISYDNNPTLPLVHNKASHQSPESPRQLNAKMNLNWVQKSPIETVYWVWRKLSNLLEFLSRLLSVIIMIPRESHLPVPRPLCNVALPHWEQKEAESSFSTAWNLGWPCELTWPIECDRSDEEQVWKLGLQRTVLEMSILAISAPEDTILWRSPVWFSGNW